MCYRIDLYIRYSKLSYIACAHSQREVRSQLHAVPFRSVLVPNVYAGVVPGRLASYRICTACSKCDTADFSGSATSSTRSVVKFLARYRGPPPAQRQLENVIAKSSWSGARELMR